MRSGGTRRAARSSEDRAPTRPRRATSATRRRASTSRIDARSAGSTSGSPTTSCVSTPDSRAGRCRRGARLRAHDRSRSSSTASARRHARTRVARPLVCSMRRIVLRPRKRRAHARASSGWSRSEHLGDELERASPILGSVRAARVLEELERLLERREHDDRLGLAVPARGSGSRRGDAAIATNASATPAAPEDRRERRELARRQPGRDPVRRGREVRRGPPARVLDAAPVDRSEVRGSEPGIHAEDRPADRGATLRSSVQRPRTRANDTRAGVEFDRRSSCPDGAHGLASAAQRVASSARCVSRARRLSARAGLPTISHGRNVGAAHGPSRDRLAVGRATTSTCATIGVSEQRDRAASSVALRLDSLRGDRAGRRRADPGRCLGRESGSSIASAAATTRRRTTARRRDERDRHETERRAGGACAHAHAPDHAPRAPQVGPDEELGEDLASGRSTMTTTGSMSSWRNVSRERRPAALRSPRAALATSFRRRRAGRQTDPSADRAAGRRSRSTSGKLCSQVGSWITTGTTSHRCSIAASHSSSDGDRDEVGEHEDECARRHRARVRREVIDRALEPVRPARRTPSTRGARRAAR